MTPKSTSMPSRSSENVHSMTSLLHVFVGAGKVTLARVQQFCWRVYKNSIKNSYALGIV